MPVVCVAHLSTATTTEHHHLCFPPYNHAKGFQECVSLPVKSVSMLKTVFKVAPKGNIILGSL